jgi:hypothetical protein
MAKQMKQKKPRLLNIGSLANISYNNLGAQIDEEYLVVNEKSRKIVAKIRILRPPKEYDVGVRFTR